MRFVPLFVLKFQMAARAERDAAAGQSRCEERLIELLGERPLKLDAPASTSIEATRVQLHEEELELYREPYSPLILAGGLFLYTLASWLLLGAGLQVEPASPRLLIWGTSTFSIFSLMIMSFVRARRAIQRGEESPPRNRENILYMITIVIAWLLCFYEWTPEDAEHWIMSMMCSFFLVGSLIAVETQARFRASAQVKRAKVQRVAGELTELMLRNKRAMDASRALEDYDRKRAVLEATYGLRYDLSRSDYQVDRDRSRHK